MILYCECESLDIWDDVITALILILCAREISDISGVLFKSYVGAQIPSLQRNRGLKLCGVYVDVKPQPL